MSKNIPTTNPVTHFDAVAAWAYGELADFFSTSPRKVIFRGDTIVIDWVPAEGAPTLTTLTRSSGGMYKGESVWAGRTPEEQTASVEAVLYSSERGHILVGEEKWSSGEQDWFVVQLSNAAAGGTAGGTP